MKFQRIAVITLTSLFLTTPAMSADSKDIKDEKKPADIKNPPSDVGPSRHSLAGLFSSMPGQSRWDGYLGVTGRSMSIVEQSTVVPSVRIGTAWNAMGLIGVTGSWLQQEIKYQDRAVSLTDYGVYAGWTVNPAWYVNGTFLLAYKTGSAKIHEVDGDAKAEAQKFKAIEPTLLVEVNVTETFRIGAEYGTRILSGGLPPELQKSDLGTKYMGLTFTFLGQ
jgi:hypothetical protein